MAPTILVRYGELALKSPPVRREFEHTLGRNLLEQFRVAGETCRLRADHGHLYLEVADGSLGVRLARRVFGVTSVSEVVEVDTDRALLARTLLDLADGALAPGARFAVRARRTGQHPFTSQELARELGAAIFARWPDRGLRVDLDHPEVEFHVEVRGPRSYLYRARSDGPGGLPLGVAGRVVASVDGVRGALGAFLMMKRGCRVTAVVSKEGTALARDILVAFDPGLVLHEGGAAPADVLRELLRTTRADGIVLPLALEEFPAARAEWGDHVLFSPTVGFSEEEVGARWAAVRTLVA